MQWTFLGHLSPRESARVTERMVKHIVLKTVFAGAVLQPDMMLELAAWMIWLVLASWLAECKACSCTTEVLCRPMSLHRNAERACAQRTRPAKHATLRPPSEPMSSIALSHATYSGSSIHAYTGVNVLLKPAGLPQLASRAFSQALLRTVWRLL